MNVPGSPRLHLWVGLLVALVGVLVGGYAYTSWRIYHLHYLPVALVGLALVIGGSALAGYGQANRPRLGGRGAGDEPGVLERLKASIAGLVGSEDDEEDEAEEAGRGDEAGDDTSDEEATDETDASAEDEGTDAGEPDAGDGEEPASQR